MSSHLTALTERLDALQRELGATHEHPDEARALALCERHAFEPLALGGLRIALDVTDTKVAKVAWRRAGLISNEVEWRLWRGASARLRELLAPASLLTAAGVLIQGRCLPVSFEVFPNAAALVRELAAHGIVDAAVNLGLYDRRLVCYDYALLRAELAARILASGVK